METFFDDRRAKVYKRGACQSHDRWEIFIFVFFFCEFAPDTVQGLTVMRGLVPLLRSSCQIGP